MTVPIQVRLPDDLTTFIRATAAEYEISQNQVMVEAIDRHRTATAARVYTAHSIGRRAAITARARRLTDAIAAHMDTHE
jgi:hypothetical protein